MKKSILYLFFLNFVLVAACQRPAITDNTQINLAGHNGADSAVIQLNTDRAVYHPGDQVVFTADKALPSGTVIHYYQGGQEISSSTATGKVWQWQTPAADFKGYLVSLENKGKILATIAVDASSDPSKFPRNGFLSDYGKLSEQQMTAVLQGLNRLHINWIQFYDWGWKHQRPLAGTVGKPDPSWTDIASRTNYQSTVEGYITKAHQLAMKTLSYNLCYGVLDDAASDGVMDGWYMFTDKNHSTKDVMSLSAPFKSSIYLVNPGNAQWQSYLAARNKDLYQVYDFDGYQIDQLGSRDKTLYDYNGNAIDLPAGFASFIEAMKKADPDKKLVMNAVNQYGQQSIAQSPVEFLYTEVWSPNDGYADLASVIQNNDQFSKNQKKTVLTAYMDYDKAEQPGQFNTPGVLMTDAVIFAFGGSHLEMGEHMLGKEYFPNNNLQMPNALKTAIIHYYDFLTAYQNLLRDGGDFNVPSLKCTNGKMTLNNWPPQQGAVSIVGKDLGSAQIIHLLNFTNANSLLWRDKDGAQAAQTPIKDAQLVLSTTKSVKKLWLASPDKDFGSPVQLEFTQQNGQLHFTLPYLAYWDMIVAEF